MDAFTEERHIADLKIAASTPQLADGYDIRAAKYEVRERKNGIYALFRDGCYVVTTRTRDRELAEKFRDLYALQDEAKKKKIIDARFTQATVVIDYRKRTYPKEIKASTRKSVFICLKLIRTYVEGRRLQDLDDEWLADTRDHMIDVRGYGYGYFFACVSALVAAIYRFCESRLCPAVICFARPAKAPGRERVLTEEERDRILRWAGGTENYDPKTGVWTPNARLRKWERNRRLMVYRLLRLQLPLASRPGIHGGMSWEPHPEFGWIDLAEGVLHRLPEGASARDRKGNPAVELPPDLLAEVRRWKEADGDQKHVFRTTNGKPLSYDALHGNFLVSLTELGIFGVTGHVIRHTAITWMVRRKVPARMISAIAGVSLEVLRDRYDHTDDKLLQAMGHDIMDAMMRR
ncbi:hypothetical protein [Bradyrhizobium yuanmingense]|uniref:hypothetical protein n=1 Tax=Bradyrhizobium yuanmingense TaxID=108015 RepID=UPI001CD2FE46|nr:hypothetical protein [Bradyrhizobium yuanmingense]MCA1529461.1 hypothetical protein [Bradyrhizobium yuanmingense]